MVQDTTMVQDIPMTERVQRMRKKYRASVPHVDITRYKIVTEFYRDHPEYFGIMRKAMAFKLICEGAPTYIDEEELFPGSQGKGFRAVTLYPENNFCNPFMIEQIRNDELSTGELDVYTMDEDDKKYVLDTADFWLKNASGVQTMPYIPDGWDDGMNFNGVLTFTNGMPFGTTVGHFIGGFKMPVEKGYGAIRREVESHMAEIEGKLFGDTPEKYAFWKAECLCLDGIQTYYHRYAQAARDLMETTDNEAWKPELAQMADSLDYLAEGAPRTFYEALVMLNMHNLCIALEGNLHGLSFGRLDTLLGDFYKRDVEAGILTPERAQEYMDVFFLKIAQTIKIMGGGLGYTTGLLMTLGGVDKDGNDVTNEVSYMMLNASRRLVLHDPPMAMRVHKGTPDKLWEAAIATTKMCGGVPTFENDDVIIPSLLAHGFTQEDANDYGLVGCVEPGGNGNEWTCAGGDGANNFFNLPVCVLLAMNNGVNPFPRFDQREPMQSGPATGYLYEYKSFDEFLDAVWKQMEYFVNWMCSMLNMEEYVSRTQNPLPVASLTIEGCIENGADVTWGGAKYNSLGATGIGVGNIIDSLAVIKILCFEQHKFTLREMYDAVMNNWQGYEDMRQYILNEGPHYGNGIEEVDELGALMAEKFSTFVLNAYGSRSHMRPGLWPVTANVSFGKMTWATPDGRMTGVPLADGCGACQGLDTNGPTAILRSVTHLDQTKYGNGTLLNMKFHPSAVNSPEGVKKLQELMQTYFSLGGMQLQINVVSADTLKAAQVKPEEYKDLVVRIAGFSVYFVEMTKDSQDDLISRTELNM